MLTALNSCSVYAKTFDDNTEYGSVTLVENLKRPAAHSQWQIHTI